MIEPETGEIEWEVSSEEISLTGSVCYAVAFGSDGTPEWTDISLYEK